MKPSPTPDVAGLAALAICESLLLALYDRKILPEKEIIGVLRDAAAAHEAEDDADKTDLGSAVAAAINAIRIEGTTSRGR